MWIAAGVPGFALGIVLAALLLDAVAPGLGFWPRTLVLGGVAGAVAGVPLGWVLRRSLGVGASWAPLDALAWLVFFPGMIPGLALVRVLARSEA